MYWRVVMKVVIGAMLGSGLVELVGVGVSRDMLSGSLGVAPVVVLVPVLMVLLLLASWQLRLISR